MCPVVRYHISPQRVCPEPGAWHRVHQELTLRWKRDGYRGQPPPMPLILAGWVYSNDVEKKQRWDQTVSWAMQCGCGDLLDQIKDSEYYTAYQLTNYVVGPMGGPMYLDWSSVSKTRPPDVDVEKALVKLRSDWAEIAGSELAQVSQPLEITGKKRRRLLVAAKASYTPNWGGWEHLARGPDRRSFTRLRSSVNEAISPLMVDHIDFVVRD